MIKQQRTGVNLQWEVFVSKRPGLARDIPLGDESLQWVANSSTLIYGEKDAVLVDTLLTIDQSQQLLDRVVASGKNLVAIYLTHGHGDHCFGIAPLLEHFPRAKAIAIPEVVEAMREQTSAAVLDTFWRKLFPGQIPDQLVVADPLESGEFQLDGHRFIAVKAGRTDTAHTTSLYVPSIGLIVAGDVAYNGIHPFLGETDTQSRLEWISALDNLESLLPRTVIAGHKVPENADDPRIIGETRKYLQDFNRLDEATATARQLYDAMLDLYPDRVNPGSLWGAANRAKPQPQ